MKEALLGKNGLKIDASKARKGPGYYCPHCTVSVFLKRGKKQVPHFAHQPGEGKPECEEFHPWVNDLNVSVDQKPKEVENDPSEIGLCIAEGDSEWNLILRIPEIGLEQLGDCRLSDLRNGKVEVFVDQICMSFISLLDLRPGVGVARVPILPTSHNIDIVPTGNWPQNIEKMSWRLTASGLNNLGTLFRMTNGEWTRVRDNSGVNPNEKLVLVSNNGMNPPTVVKAGVFQRTSEWQFWDVLLPPDISGEVADWISSLGYFLCHPTWDIEILSPPCEFSKDARTPKFYSGDNIYLIATAPHQKSIGTLSIVANGDESLETVTPSSGNNRVFLKLCIPNPAICEIGIKEIHNTFLKFEVINRLDSETIQTILSKIPRLRIWINDTEIVEGKLNVIEDRVKTIKMETVGIDVKLSLAVVNEKRRGLWQNLIPKEAEKIVVQELRRSKKMYFSLDAGSFGSFKVQVSDTQIDSKQLDSPRVFDWLSRLPGDPNFAVETKRMINSQDSAHNSRLKYSMINDANIIKRLHMTAYEKKLREQS